jgi:formamidopyrimidine-DNA glycosylase
MPELPEVETVKREISPYVKGKIIRDVKIIDARVIKGISPREFKKKLTGDTILNVERRAKYLSFKLKSGKYLVIHLGMTGRLLFSPDKYVKVIFKLSGNKTLYYSDLRLFGKVKLYNHYPILKLGPEPLSKEFTPRLLKELLSKRKTNIKSLLLDQRFLSGLGNIYASESLFCAGIDPRRKANTLKDYEIKNLNREIKKVLTKALAHKGTSFSWFVDAEGKKGGFQLKLMVYRKEGKPCPRCKTPIKRIIQSNRGTYYCPRCQK